MNIRQVEHILRACSGIAECREIVVIGGQAFDILRDPNRKSESVMGNLITDAMRWMVDQYETEPVDVAIESNGVIRDNILS